MGKINHEGYRRRKMEKGERAVIKIFEANAKAAALRTVAIMNSENEKEARLAAADVIKFLVPKAQSPLVAINYEGPRIASYLGLPPAPEALEATRNVIEAEPAIRKVLPEGSGRPYFPGKPKEIETTLSRDSFDVEKIKMKAPEFSHSPMPLEGAQVNQNEIDVPTLKIESGLHPGMKAGD